MFGQNNEIHGRNLEAINQKLESEIQRFNERQEVEVKTEQKRKPNTAMKNMATLLITQIVGN